MDINKIMEFFYKRTSKRVKEAVKKTGKNYEEIFPNDPKQISWIINNNRTKNNRYLICDAVIKYEDKDKKYEHYGLIVYCDFKDKKEVLWGTDSEIENYLFELFKLLYNEYINCEKSTAELILSDYVPYAKYYSYSENLSKFPNLINIYEISKEYIDIENNIKISKNEAIEVLYNKCKYNFAKIFNEFAENTESYKKIDKIFKENFIEKRFIPMIKEYIPDEFSLGLRVRNIISSDLNKYLVAINGVKEQTYLHKLLKASIQYINSLEEVQAEMIDIGKKVSEYFKNHN